MIARTIPKMISPTNTNVTATAVVFPQNPLLFAATELNRVEGVGSFVVLEVESVITTELAEAEKVGCGITSKVLEILSMTLDFDDKLLLDDTEMLVIVEVLVEVEAVGMKVVKLELEVGSRVDVIVEKLDVLAVDITDDDDIAEEIEVDNEREDEREDDEENEVVDDVAMMSLEDVVLKAVVIVRDRGTGVLEGESES